MSSKSVSGYKLLIHVGGLEIFLSDAVQLAENGRNAGVEVIYKRYEGMPHVFQMLDFSLPEVMDSFNEIRTRKVQSIIFEIWITK